MSQQDDSPRCVTCREPTIVRTFGRCFDCDRAVDVVLDVLNEHEDSHELVIADEIVRRLKNR